ncbi:hypothetical protein ACFVJS_22550 [Nocardioides sp. NPDC057772]|uniref:hypothetical protein n=1 Tax=Nocardioides sp. NPDC057772 TaxID=3346245 RepID=UPI0036713969
MATVTSTVDLLAGNWTVTADARGMVVAVPAAPNGGVLLVAPGYNTLNAQVMAGIYDRSTEPTDPPTDPPTEEPTDPPTEPGLYCGSATNAQHQAAGRAHSYGTNPYNPYYADVSEDYMGQGDATVTTLQESAGGRFDVVTTC